MDSSDLKFQLVFYLKKGMLRKQKSKTKCQTK